MTRCLVAVMAFLFAGVPSSALGADATPDLVIESEHLETLQAGLSQAQTVVVRAELACEDMTVKACREGALERAKRAALEQGAAALLVSAAVTETLRAVVDAGADAETRQAVQDRIASHVQGTLVDFEVLDKGWVGDESYFYEIEAVVTGRLSADLLAVAGVADVPGPPAVDRLDEAPAVDPVKEVLRLRELIGKNREAIEAARTAGMEQVEQDYRESLAAIAPKDQFETQAEYHARDAREKSDAALERATSAGDVNREHDALLKSEVEPLVQQVGELLGRPDIIPEDALDVHIGNYDAEHGVFTGSLKIDSGLMETQARIYLPMRKEDARELWKNRESLSGKVRLSMDVRSLGRRDRGTLA